MKTTLKSKSKALLRVPQNREDTVSYVGRIGTLRRAIAHQKSLADEAIRLAGEQLEANTAELVKELGELESGVQTWCEANRMALTSDGKVKYHDLGTGRINWRQRPPKVSLRGGETIIEACKKLGLLRFLRIKEEINRDAMLADPDTARQIAGVSISSECEDFVIEPSEIETSLMSKAGA